jgi:hypothetical protein
MRRHALIIGKPNVENRGEGDLAKTERKDLNRVRDVRAVEERSSFSMGCFVCAAPRGHAVEKELPLGERGRQVLPGLIINAAALFDGQVVT